MTAAVYSVVDDGALREMYSSLNYFQRQALAPELATRINDGLRREGVCRFPEDFTLATKSGDDATLRMLQDDGYCRLGSILDAGQTKEVVDHFKRTTCFNAHLVAKSDGTGRLYDGGADKFPFGSYRMQDVAGAPHLLEIANDPRIIALAANYLGCAPSLYSMNAWWSFPGDWGDGLLTQGFHRDEDDFKNCVLFIYLTDVDEDTGAHEYIRTTQDPAAVERRLKTTDFPFVTVTRNGVEERLAVKFDDLFAGAGYGGDHVYSALFGGLIDRIEGAEGEGFISDATGLHRALRPNGRPRLIAWIRYGMFQNRAYLNDALAPIADPALQSRIGSDLKSRYINRLVVGAA